ncbi:MAG: hypothetical protein E7222_12780 [Clostridiales bacterium]|uniref:hypothetical protein n=1 Tax=Aminipila sp. TaxID=2060095 RepID=UPI001DB57590|nr:hypothetical protein [Aminipila sp.]MBE6035552.1 hypothetical protein [Clostridiales bacterium]
MKVSWLKNPNNVVHVNTEIFAERFGKEIGILDLKAQIEKFREEPSKEGKIVRGTKRSAIKLFIPNLMFDEIIENGEKVWVYIGSFYQCYALY